jgi:hypothetical protein
MANTATNLETIWTKIAAVTRDEVRLAVLQDEVELLEHAEGLDYAVRTRLNTRIEEIQK